MRDLLDTGMTQCPSFVDTADDIFEGKEKIREMDEGAVNRIKEAFQVVLEAQGLPGVSTVASSPLNANLLWGWGRVRRRSRREDPSQMDSRRSSPGLRRSHLLQWRLSQGHRPEPGRRTYGSRADPPIGWMDQLAISRRRKRRSSQVDKGCRVQRFLQSHLG